MRRLHASFPHITACLTSRISRYKPLVDTVGALVEGIDLQKPLIDFLFAHQTRAEFTCRFSWAVGSIARWDNRCVLHHPIHDYHGDTRLLHRVTLQGDKPR